MNVWHPSSEQIIGVLLKTKATNAPLEAIGYEVKFGQFDSAELRSIISASLEEDELVMVDPIDVNIFVNSVKT